MATKSDLPPFEDYFWPTIEAMKAKGGSATIEELEEEIAKRLHLSDDVLAVPHVNSARTQFQYELAWVRTYLKKYGASENSKVGVWSLTDLGERLSRTEAKDIPAKI